MTNSQQLLGLIAVSYIAVVDPNFAQRKCDINLEVSLGLECDCDSESTLQTPDKHVDIQCPPADVVGRGCASSKSHTDLPHAELVPCFVWVPNTTGGL